MQIRIRLAALVAIPALVLGIGLATAAAASAAAPAVTGPFNYEVDTGGFWWLSNTPISEAGSGPGYADAGVVVALGPLSSLTGITVTGSGPLSDNIWISNGNTDEAAFPGGPHALSDGVDFAYGFDQGGGQSFYMASGVFDGHVKTLAELQQEYPNAEAFAWVGLTNVNGPATGHVLKVNGAPAAAYVKVTADGTASAR